jgi:hypothetical protein
MNIRKTTHNINFVWLSGKSQYSENLLDITYVINSFETIARNIFIANKYLTTYEDMYLVLHVNSSSEMFEIKIAIPQHVCKIF